MPLHLYKQLSAWASLLRLDNLQRFAKILPLSMTMGSLPNAYENSGRQKSLPVGSSKMRKHLAIAAAFILTIFGSRAVQATTIEVPGDVPTIQGAITAATNGDTVLVAPGTYVEHDISFGGKAIRVTGTNPTDSVTVATTVVDADSLGRGFVFTSGETSSATLAGLTVKNAYYASASGGGAYVSSASPTFTYVVFRRNVGKGGAGVKLNDSLSRFTSCDFLDNETIAAYVGDGGAVDFSNADPVFTNCRFVDNTSWQDGGAIRIAGRTLTATDCVFRNNWARYSSGAVHSPFQRTLTFTRCTFDSNDADQAGAIASAGPITMTDCDVIGNVSAADGITNFGSTFAIRDCNWIGNSAYEGGGALSIYGTATGTITCCRFDGNSSAMKGGAIQFNWQSSGTVKNCLFEKNTAGNGGAIAVLESANVTLTNVTCVSDTATVSGGAFYSSSTAVSTVKNVIFWDNVPNEIAALNTPVVTYSDVEGGYSGTGNINANPKFATYQGLEYVLNAGSPCIDAGDPTMSDQVHDSHPLWPPQVPNGQRADMGAYGGPSNGCMYQ